MSTGPLHELHRQLTDAADALGAVAGPAAGDTELLTVLTFCEGMTRRLDRIAVATVATLERRGTFAERGYKSTIGALGDLLGWERFEASRRVTAAEQAHPRTGLDGAELPARLPATGARVRRRPDRASARRGDRRRARQRRRGPTGPGHLGGRGGDARRTGR